MSADRLHEENTEVDPRGRRIGPANSSVGLAPQDVSLISSTALLIESVHVGCCANLELFAGPFQELYPS